MFLFIIIFFPLSLFIGKRCAATGDDYFLIRTLVSSWVLFIPLIALINEIMPFTGGGDDLSYYEISDYQITSVEQVFDFSHFMGLMEQPGYPWILYILNNVVGHDLLAFKAFNFFILLLLSLTWYRIGLVLEGPKFARRILVLILLFTPLWFYTFFLLKDIIITLLQSLFLLAAVQFWVQPRMRHLISISISIFILIFFRTPLVLQNLVVFVGGNMIKNFDSQKSSNGLIRFILSMIPIALLYPIVTNPSIMLSLGIFSEHRVINTNAIVEISEIISEGSQINRSLFPFLYLLIETVGFNKQAWVTLDAAWLRGLLAIPWIIIGIPFFILGLFKLFRPRADLQLGSGTIKSLKLVRVISTPWILLLVFVLTSIAISWNVGDTTRWRITDFPIIGAIALNGWMNTNRDLRKFILFCWFVFVFTSVAIFQALAS